MNGADACVCARVCARVRVRVSAGVCVCLLNQKGGSEPEPPEVILNGTDGTVAGVAIREMVLQQGWSKSVLTEDESTAPVQLIALRAVLQGQ